MSLTMLRGTDTVSTDTFNKLISELTATFDKINNTLAGLNKENSFKEKNTFEKDIVVNRNATIFGEIFSEGTYSSSDERFKKDFEEIQNGLEKILELKAYTYDKNDKRESGFKASEVKKLMEECVIEINGKLMVRYEGIIPYLVSSIHKLHEEIEKLKK